jgi:TonB family protein
LKVACLAALALTAASSSHAPPPPPPAPVASEHITDPSCLDCSTPKYPFELNFARVGGKANLLLSYDSKGKITNVKLLQSSGNRDLDRAAVNHAMTWRVQAGTRGGVPTAGQAQMFVVFEPFVAAGAELAKFEGEGSIPLVGKDGKLPAAESLRTVAEATDFLAKSCRVDLREQGFHSKAYLHAGAGGESNFTVFDAASGMGPSVVRRRFTSDGRGPVLKTSYVCGADKAGCAKLRAYLANGYSRPVSAHQETFGKPWFESCDGR